MPESYIDINCDIGEGFAFDAALMPYVSSANIACGGHAGNEQTMQHAITLCLANGVAIGAHPSFMDVENFGRKAYKLSQNDLYEIISKQLFLFSEICSNAGVFFHHVKLHGALYNMAGVDNAVATTVASAIFNCSPLLIVYAQASGCLMQAAKQINLRSCAEVFADRTYQADGSLTPRSYSQALIETEQAMLAQVMQMVEQQTVRTVDGTEIAVQAQTVCIHGDGQHALAFAKKINETFKQHKISIKPMY